jgi:hypothetical protein
VEVWRWFCVAGFAGAAACNAYDENLAGQGQDARAPSAGASTTGGGNAGSGIVPPADGAHGGTGGIGDDASGAGGASGGSDAGSGGTNATGSDAAGPDATPTVDAPKDTPPSMADAGPDVGLPVDAPTETAVVRDVAVPEAPILGESMIDDMEDPDEAILTVDGRRGAWFVLNDGTDGGVQVPAMGTPFNMTAIAGGRGASTYAAHTSGQGFTSWSPVIGFWLKKSPATFKQLYDASRYNAITFWAKTTRSDAARFSASVRVQLPDKNTDPDGQVCTADGSLGCSDHFGRNIDLTPDWVKYTIRFSSLQQAGFGNPAPAFDAAHVYGIEFQFTLGSSFDCWIDDIAFVSL